MSNIAYPAAPGFESKVPVKLPRNHEPQIILCPHEEISVAMAHGYGAGAEKPVREIPPIARRHCARRWRWWKRVAWCW